VKYNKLIHTYVSVCAKGLFIVYISVGMKQMFFYIAL
jgi:hypothetical protein